MCQFDTITIPGRWREKERASKILSVVRKRVYPSWAKWIVSARQGVLLGATKKQHTPKERELKIISRREKMFLLSTRGPEDFTRTNPSRRAMFVPDREAGSTWAFPSFADVTTRRERFRAEIDGHPVAQDGIAITCRCVPSKMVPYSGLAACRVVLHCCANKYVVTRLQRETATCGNPLTGSTSCTRLCTSTAATCLGSDVLSMHSPVSAF